MWPPCVSFSARSKRDRAVTFEVLPQDDWSAASFDGARKACARAVATASPEQRLAWLEAALELAAASGALARARAARQALADQRFAAPAPGGRP